MLEQGQSIEETKPRLRLETSAWLMLLGFFLLFCTIVVSASYISWRYYNTALVPVDGTMLRVHVNTGVTFQARGDARAQSLERSRNPCPESDEICKPMAAGDRVKTQSEAGYGPVASIKLPDQTQIDLWAHPTGSDLMLDRYQVSRWTNRRQEVVLQQEAGYARYDVSRDPSYAEVDYTVEITEGVQVLLTPGGSYSINVPRDGPERVRTRTDTGEPMLVEVTVRSGSATVQSGDQQVTITSGEKVQADAAGGLGVPKDAVWELIEDGNFIRHSTEEYAAGSDTWSLLRGPLAQGMADDELNGIFRISQTCPPERPSFCEAADQVQIGQFRRDGGQQRPFLTGITQQLDLDVSEYRSLQFSAWVRVVTQTVEMAGITGSECPIMIRLTYKETSPTDQEKQHVTCVYTGSETRIRAPGIEYRLLPQFAWYHLKIELRDNTALEKVRYLQRIDIEARGHDYVSELTGLSLMGAQ